MEHRSTASAISLIFVGGVAYLVYYFIFGIIAYQFSRKCVELWNSAGKMES